MNMVLMLVTCATSQSRGWLKLEENCQVWREVEARNAQARVGCRGGALQARQEARVRWRDGAAAPGVQ